MKGKISGVMLMLLLASMLTLSFNIQQIKASGTIYITPSGEVVGTDKIQRDGNTYTFTDNINDYIVIQKDNITLDGAYYTLQGNGSGNGIELRHRFNVTVKNIEIKDFDTGILIQEGGLHKIFGNNVTKNKSYGIYLDLSLGNTIYTNNITENFDGVEFYRSCENTVSANNITANNIGIPLIGTPLISASNNYICANNITKNNLGVLLYQSLSNKFGHNNFTNNTIQVYSDGLPNTWDYGYPSGGNYWSDYRGRYPNATEIDDSGIWNTSYVIEENNQDNYPFMNPWIAMHDIAVVNVTTHRIVVADNCSRPEHQNLPIHNYNVRVCNVTVENQGDFPETFNVTLYASNITDLVIGKQLVILAPHTNMTLTLKWNTASLGMADHKFYTLKAVVDTVDGEVDTFDNTLINGLVRVVLPGNVNGDEIANMEDIYTELILRFMKKEGETGYTYNADINDDGIINMQDIYTAIIHFMQTEP